MKNDSLPAIAAKTTSDKMIKRLLNKAFALALLAALGLSPTVAQAGPYDVTLRGLGRPVPNDLNDPAYLRFKKLGNELGLAMAPRPLAPAETLGISGFEFSLVSTFADINESADYWQGQPGSPVFLGVADGDGIPVGFWIPTLHIRKGLPLSTELGITASYLSFSEMFLLGAEAKIGIHEKFTKWSPDIAVRGAIGSLFGNSDMKLTTIEVDVLTSYAFGIDGVMHLTPYAGWGLVFVDVISGVIDETPYSVTDRIKDQNGQESGSLYVFERLLWNENRNQRVILGARASFAFIEVAYELDLAIHEAAQTTLLSHSLKVGFDT